LKGIECVCLKSDIHLSHVSMSPASTIPLMLKPVLDSVTDNSTRMFFRAGRNPSIEKLLKDAPLTNEVFVFVKSVLFNIILIFKSNNECQCESKD